MEVYQTNSLDLFSALFHLSHDNKHDIEQVLKIEHNEKIYQNTTLERKPNRKCKCDINQFTKLEKEFIQMFDFQQSRLTKKQFEKVLTIILKHRNVYAKTKFDVGKTKVKLNLPMKKDNAVLKK